MKLSYDRARMRRITAASEFGKVAVLYGGVSTEREVSLVSGAAVLAGLKRRGIDATGVDPRDESLFDLRKRGFDRAFIALHGPGGEDGSVQGALEVLGLPYTGSGVQGSALGMDKLRTKRLAAALGGMTADSVVLRTVGDCAVALERLGLPLIVKPATQGSSVGMSKVTTDAEMEPAYRAAAAVDDVVFAEKWITRRRIHGGSAAPGACCRPSASKPPMRSTTTRPSTSATIRSTTAPRGCRHRPRRTWQVSPWLPSTPLAPRAGAAPISWPITPAGRCCWRSTPCLA